LNLWRLHNRPLTLPPFCPTCALVHENEATVVRSVDRSVQFLTESGKVDSVGGKFVILLCEACFLYTTLIDGCNFTVTITKEVSIFVRSPEPEQTAHFT